jgi:hypothetical protein
LVKAQDFGCIDEGIIMGERDGSHGLPCPVFFQFGDVAEDLVISIR